MFKLKNESGITLIEVVIVMVLISLVLIPIFNMFTMNFKTLITSEQKTKALLKAQEILEKEKDKLSNLQGELNYPQLTSRKEDGLASEVSLIKTDSLYTIEVRVFCDQVFVHLITKVGDHNGG